MNWGPPAAGPRCALFVNHITRLGQFRLSRQDAAAQPATCPFQVHPPGQTRNMQIETDGPFPWVACLPRYRTRRRDAVVAALLDCHRNDALTELPAPPPLSMAQISRRIADRLAECRRALLTVAGVPMLSPALTSSYQLSPVQTSHQRQKAPAMGGMVCVINKAAFIP